MKRLSAKKGDCSSIVEMLAWFIQKNGQYRDRDLRDSILEEHYEV